MLGLAISRHVALSKPRKYLPDINKNFSTKIGDLFKNGLRKNKKITSIGSKIQGQLDYQSFPGL